jgi:hypothetical protein
MLKVLFMGIAATVVLGGCVTVPPILNVTDLTSVDFSKISSFKRGESCTTFLLGILPIGSTRITSAIRDGHIKNVKIMEYETRSYVIVNQFCVIAYGT